MMMAVRPVLLSFLHFVVFFFIPVLWRFFVFAVSLLPFEFGTTDTDELKDYTAAAVTIEIV